MTLVKNTFFAECGAMFNYKSFLYMNENFNINKEIKSLPYTKNRKTDPDKSVLKLDKYFYKKVIRNILPKSK